MLLRGGPQSCPGLGRAMPSAHGGACGQGQRARRVGRRGPEGLTCEACCCCPAVSAVCRKKGKAGTSVLWRPLRLSPPHTPHPHIFTSPCSLHPMLAHHILTSLLSPLTAFLSSLSRWLAQMTHRSQSLEPPALPLQCFHVALRGGRLANPARCRAQDPSLPHPWARDATSLSFSFTTCRKGSMNPGPQSMRLMLARPSGKG